MYNKPIRPIKELLNKQAEAEKKQRELLKTAEQYEAEARKIRLKASAPIVIKSKEMAAAKAKNLERYGAALGKVKLEAQQAPLKKAQEQLGVMKWRCAMANQEKGIAVYQHPNNPNRLIKISDGAFSVHEGLEVIIDHRSLSQLGYYLK